MNNNNKKQKTKKKQRENYLHRGSCAPFGKMTGKENLEQSQKPFLRAPIMQIVRSHNYWGS